MKEIDPRILKVLSADEFRDMLPNSGVFDMVDCSVEVICPLNSEVSEIKKMVMLIESMINVTDFKVTGIPTPEQEAHYLIKITDTPLNANASKGRTKR